MGGLSFCQFQLYLLSFWVSEGKMLVFGHAGITLGSAALLTIVLSKSRFNRTTGSESIQPSLTSFRNSQPPNDSPSYKTSWLSSLVSHIDIRILLVGSLLPDIIDKPIGHFVLRDTISNGRIICHTLSFLIVVTLAGLYLYQSRGRTSLLAVSFGTFTHLIFDQMWRAPRTLFWPIYGFTFDRADITDWIPNILRALVTDPHVYVPELAGTAILIWFLLRLVRRRRVFYFLKSGQVQ